MILVLMMVLQDSVAKISLDYAAGDCVCNESKKKVVTICGHLLSHDFLFVCLF